MKIGIDVSQTAYEGTGVGNYVKYLVEELLRTDKENEYILFYSSLRKPFSASRLDIPQDSPRVTVKTFKLPPTLLDLLWNKLHICPIENLIGDVDVFISSDWTQPPAKNARKVTILYDLIVYTYPEETHNHTRFNIKNLILSPNIVASQKRRLKWVKKECDAVMCISESTKKDAVKIGY
jgi:hypothetical protein